MPPQTLPRYLKFHQRPTEFADIHANHSFIVKGRVRRYVYFAGLRLNEIVTMPLLPSTGFRLPLLTVAAMGSQLEKTIARLRRFR